MCVFAHQIYYSDADNIGYLLYVLYINIVSLDKFALKETI